MVTLVGGAVLDLTSALRLRVEASAAIVDDGWTEEPQPASEHESDESFYRFHSTLGNFRLLVDGISQGFAIEREFEQPLWKAVTTKLKRLGQADSDDVVIVHGQSGTGKSIALARLTRKIRRELRHPTVVATHRIPTYEDIETFCLEAERLASTATVLICDSNQAPQRYDDLASALRSRGRRLLIVGTCYRMENIIVSDSGRFIEAPSHVSPSELAAFERMQRKFCPDLLLRHNATDSSTDSIFAMLYRQLPASRGRLAAGVSSETRIAEGQLRERGSNVPRPVIDLSPLALQLIETGLVNRESQLFEDDDTLAALGLDAAGRLIDYVMAAGRLNCPLPVNLVFRLLGQTDTLNLDQLIHLFSDLDLFRWSQDEEGSDYLIAPRLQLEAELVCRRRLTSDTEIQRLIELIRITRPGVDQGTERSFLLNLLYMIDRNGPRKSAYSSGYLRFADALKDLREQYRVFSPDLVLRECVFRRRAVFQSQGEPDINMTEDERLSILEEALRTVEKTLLLIDDRDLTASRRTKQSLVTERSAIYGYLAVQRARSGTGEVFWSDYLAARLASGRAIGIDRSLHPIEIALWTGRDILRLKGDHLSNRQRAEVLADLYATIDSADDIFRVKNRQTMVSIGSNQDDIREDSVPEDGVTPDQRVRYLERRSVAAHVMRDRSLDDDSLRELERMAPAAVTYLIARRRAEPLDATEPPLHRELRQIAASAADYISSRVDAGVRLDDRCQRLLLRLRWAQATGERLMFNRRGRTPVDQHLLFDLHGIVSSLNEQGGADARNRDRFLEAVLSWLLRDTSRAIEIWRSLSDDTEYEDPSRVVRWLVMTDKHGAPCQFRGRVEIIGGNFWVRVTGIDRPIKLLSREFPSDDLARGRELREFGIAFSYIGPIADPL